MSKKQDKQETKWMLRRTALQDGKGGVTLYEIVSGADGSHVRVSKRVCGASPGTDRDFSQIVACVNWCAGHADLDAVEIAPKGTLAALREVLRTCEDGVIHRSETGKPQWSAFDHLKSIVRPIISLADAQKGGK